MEAVGQLLHDGQQGVPAGGLPRREDHTAEKRVGGIHHSALLLVRDERVTVPVHDGFTGRLRSAGPMIMPPWSDRPCGRRAGDGDVLHVAVVVDVRALPVVAAQSVGHLEGGARGVVAHDRRTQVPGAGRPEAHAGAQRCARDGCAPRRRARERSAARSGNIPFVGSLEHAQPVAERPDHHRVHERWWAQRTGRTGASPPGLRKGIPVVRGGRWGGGDRDRWSGRPSGLPQLRYCPAQAAPSPSRSEAHPCGT